MSDWSGNPFFARKKLWQKKDCNGKRGLLKKIAGNALRIFKKTRKKKDKNKNLKKIGTDCFVPRNDK